ncbi:hypothetical protein GQX73_g7718 [Xylaria multiplex]|uniref:Copper homeostasis protein cutC homolog n=1 Tax=Xylaria multiplex TaxID=323545 RepID=A0A7C8IKK6_9PEZI|nr:hypothetical protein GQX73_g7718 [Xylaria multiplex]
MTLPRLGLEIPAFGALAAISATTLGATRIELNALGSYSEGGLTPSFEDLKQVTSTLDQRPPLRIMIRPRGPPRVPPSSGPIGASERDFRYNNEEFEEMEASIRAFKGTDLLNADLGDGFVFGILGDDCTRGRRCWVDEKRCIRLVQATRPFKCVFHRAFDEIVSCDDAASDELARPAWMTGLEVIVACGFDSVLTSGGLGKAINNTEMLAKIIRKAAALRVEIIIGGGVRTANVGEIIQRLELRSRADPVYLHSACLHGDGSEHIDQGEAQGIVAQLKPILKRNSTSSDITQIDLLS